MPAVQDHIHLDVTIGTAPENAPVMTWKATSRKITPMFRAVLDETLTGDVYAHVTKRSGEPVRRFAYSYDILIRGDETYTTMQYLDMLLALTGEICSFVDHYHAADGVDHVGDILQVLFADIGDIKNEDPKLQFFYVPIVLLGTTTTP